MSEREVWGVMQSSNEDRREGPADPGPARTLEDSAPSAAAFRSPATPVAPAEALRMLQLASADPQAAAALNNSYHGRHAVADALWWRAHALTEAPSGAVDPAFERSRLQSAA